MVNHWEYLRTRREVERVGGYQVVEFSFPFFHEEKHVLQHSVWTQTWREVVLGHVDVGDKFFQEDIFPLELFSV